MTAEMLCTGVVDDIIRVIDECHVPDDAFFLAVQLPLHVVVTPEQRQDLLLFVPFAANLPVANYMSGRVFHRDFELRWEKEDGKLRAVYLGIQKYCPSSLKFVQNVTMQSPKYYYLFGERIQQVDRQKIGKPVREGDFAEVRIPRLLRYPPVLEDARRVLVAVCESIDQQTGQVDQYRFQGIKGE